jgi:hypothetical protein
MNKNGVVDLSGFGAELMLARKLFASGARTHVVCNLCAIGRKTATRIYKIAYQQSPKRGMLPWDDHWIIRSSVNNLHASIFFSIIQESLNAKSSSVEYGSQFVNAYELYCRVVANNPKPSRRELNFENFRVMDINRAWQIILQFKAHHLAFSVCKTCKAQHLIVIKKDEPFNKCPICETWTDRVGRRRWSSSSHQCKTYKATQNLDH